MGLNFKPCYVKQWDLKGSLVSDKQIAPNCGVILRQCGIALMLLAMSPTPRFLMDRFKMFTQLESRGLEIARVGS